MSGRRSCALTSAPRLLLVGSGLTGGGAEARFCRLAQHLFEGTADVAVLLDGGREMLRAAQNYTALGYAGRASYAGILARLRRAVRQTPYDVILAFGLYPNTLAWLAVRGMRSPPALVLTEITCPFTEGRFFGRMRRAVVHAVRRATYPGADLCAANSDDGVAEVVRHYGVAPARIRRLPNLVEQDALQERAAAEPPLQGADETPSFLGLTRLVKMKRIDTLIEAAAGLPKSLPWRIDIVGDGPERAALEELAARRALADRTYFHGWQKNPYPTMSRATATVLASEYEGFSNTVLESFALGAPVITSFCSTDAHRLSDKGAALGFPVGDHEALRQHLLHALTDPSLRARLRQNGRLEAERHGAARAIQEYEALVRDAATRTADRRGVARMAACVAS